MPSVSSSTSSSLIAEPHPPVRGGASSAERLAGVQRNLLGAHFLLLAGLLRKSARTDYAHLAPQDLMERRIILTLFRLEKGRVSQLANILGNDTGQISRALSSLRKDGKVIRGRQRDPYSLTPDGIALGELMDKVAVRREVELVRGLEPLQLFELGGLLANLQQKASLLLAEETSCSAHAERNEAEDLPRTGGPEIHSRMHPAVVAIAMTIARSATLAFKRLAGVSNYEWRILANVAYRPSISSTELTKHIYSDKGQVSRSLEALVQQRLLSRERSGPRGRVRFDLTQEGRRLYDIMEADSLRRNDILMADMTTAQRARLQTYLDRLITNATAMVERAG